MAKLGGEFRDPDPKRDLSRHIGRCIFLRVLADLVPETIHDLRREPLYAYSAARDATLPAVVVRPPRGPMGGPVAVEADPDWIMYRWEAWRGRTLWSELPESSVEELLTLRTAILTWGDRWGVRDDWILDVAFLTLREAYNNPADRVTFAEPDFMAMAVPGEPFKFRPWISEWETWADYESLALVALKGYRAQAEGDAADQGLLPASQKNTPRRAKNADLHFEWLVRYQVQGWSHERIASRYNRGFDSAKRTASTVARALHSTADLIQLTLRPT
jgi:hypothetical protein